MTEEKSVLANIEGMVKNHFDILQKTSTALTEAKEMLEDSLMADDTFRTAKHTVKLAQKDLAQARSSLLKKPQLAELNQKIRDLRHEKKSTQLSLFDYAAEYYRQSGADEIEAEDGTVLKIVVQGKVYSKAQNLLG